MIYSTENDDLGVHHSSRFYSPCLVSAQRKFKLDNRAISQDYRSIVIGSS